VAGAEDVHFVGLSNAGFKGALVNKSATLEDSNGKAPLRQILRCAFVFVAAGSIFKALKICRGLKTDAAT
jgi:hypothetical protein